MLALCAMAFPGQAFAQQGSAADNAAGDGEGTRLHSLLHADGQRSLEIVGSGIASIAGQPMIANMQDRQDHFAYCVQLFGGTTAFSRRLKIDERAIRRFINGERPIGDGLFADTAKALRELIAEADAAAGQISATLASGPGDP